MEEAIEKIILERVEKPGWLTTRAVQRDPRQESFENEVAQIEAVMKRLADKGLVTLWRLILEQEGVELLAAARPGLELDKDLEQRGAWAKAVRYEENG
jgi:L-fucose isomerase-like protein